MPQHKTQALDAHQVMAGLETEIVGRQVVFYPSVGSTNQVAKSMAARQADEGLVILTDEQTAGRGRHGRRWDAPFGTSLLISALFRPDLPADQANRLTMIVSLAAIDGVREVTGLEASLKWPNDILVDDLKVAGILTESSFVGDRLDFVVVGLGLNVNFDPSEVAGLPSTASSLMATLGQPVDRLALVRAILEATDQRYRALKAGESPLADWSRHLSTLGRRVQVSLADGAVEGVAEDVDQHGNLRVRKDDGTLITVAAGDVVTLRRHAD